MTREEAKQMFRDDKNSQGCYKAVLTKIDWIYDAFEKEQRDLDELEEDCHKLNDKLESYKQDQLMTIEVWFHIRQICNTMNESNFNSLKDIIIRATERIDMYNKTNKL
jgi:hypothetical protein